mgnify:CR=1 FL=1
MSQQPSAEELDIYISGLMAGVLLALLAWLFLDLMERRRDRSPTVVYEVDAEELEQGDSG